MIGISAKLSFVFWFLVKWGLFSLVLFIFLIGVRQYLREREKKDG